MVHYIEFIEDGTVHANLDGLFVIISPGKEYWIVISYSVQA